MDKTEIHQLIQSLWPENQDEPKLVETHISWVILTNKHVYKIKKPIKYSFLDFSTLAKRRYYCEQEVELNQRLTENVYLDVQAIRKYEERYLIGEGSGEIIDYAVRMHKLPADKQMDILLQEDKVSEADIRRLAEKIADFHQHAKIIDDKDFMDVKVLFDDLVAEENYLRENLDQESGEMIAEAIRISDEFIENQKHRLEHRLKAGFFRDCHGDLHSRNIFLLPKPQAFDCIEFNADFRQIDVLNEVAFLCMDLDAFGRQDLSRLFFKTYTDYFPALEDAADEKLFIYYKSYRANIRAKVNSLRAKSAEDEKIRQKAFAEVKKYLRLMTAYLETIR